MRLETNIKRYIGDSTEPKPQPGRIVDGVAVTQADLPPGSSFMEEDTGRIYRWNGFVWTVPPDSQQALDLAERTLEEVLALRREIRTGLPVETSGL